MKSKFNKYIILTVVISLFVCCKNQSSNNLDADSLTKDYKNVEIKFLNKNIYIPPNYEYINPEILIQNLLLINGDSSLAKVFEESFRRLDFLEYDYLIYADKDDYENYFIIYDGEFIALNKNLAAQYIAMLEHLVLQSSNETGVYSKKLEGRYLQSQALKVVKVKFLQLFDSSHRYTTHYVVSSGLLTCGIIVQNSSDVDFFESIQTMY